MPTFDTAANVLNDAAMELALVSADMPDALGVVDVAVAQLRRLLKGLGQDLLRGFQWTHLQKTHTFATVVGTDSYALPPDFARIVDGTQWNRSQQMPLGGPYAAQGWQLLKAKSASGTVWLNFRVVGNRFLLHPPPAAGETLAYEYVSRWWVQPAAQPSPTAEAPSANDDVLWLDARLLVAGLVLYFRGAKGMDTREAQRRYNDALAAAQGGDGAAPALSMDCTAARPYDRPITSYNVPLGGMGSVLDVGGLY